MCIKAEYLGTSRVSVPHLVFALYPLRTFEHLPNPGLKWTTKQRPLAFVINSMHMLDVVYIL